MTLIFSNVEEIENKISQSVNKASFNDFFSLAAFYEVCCDELETVLSISKRLQILHRKKETLEKMHKAIPKAVSTQATDTVDAIKTNLQAIEQEISKDLTATNQAIAIAVTEQRNAPKPDISTTT